MPRDRKDRKDCKGLEKSMEKRRYDDDFGVFWKLYPKGYRKDGYGLLQGGKDNAMKAWNGLSVEQRKRATQAVVLVKKGEFVPHAGKWLRQNYYDSLLEIESWEKESKQKKETAYRQEKERVARKEWTEWINQKDFDYLLEFIKTNPHLEWLVRELRPEIF